MKNKKYELTSFLISKASQGKMFDWANYLNQNIDQVKQSIINEGVDIESWFYEDIGHEIKLYCFWVYKDLEKVRKASKNSTLNVDKIHQTFLKENVIKGSKKKMSQILCVSSSL